MGVVPVNPLLLVDSLFLPELTPIATHSTSFVIMLQISAASTGAKKSPSIYNSSSFGIHDSFSSGILLIFSLI